MDDASHPIERRITLRMLSYWEKLRGQCEMPAEEDIDPEDLGDLWDNCFLIYVCDLGKSDYNYTYLGKAIAQAYHAGLSEEEMAGLLSPNAAKLAGHYARVIESRRPLIDEGEFRNLHNDIVKYRQCLLPLGRRGEVMAIFGGMRFKVFPS